jgi:hypothetical protein
MMTEFIFVMMVVVFTLSVTIVPVMIHAAKVVYNHCVEIISENMMEIQLGQAQMVQSERRTRNVPNCSFHRRSTDSRQNVYGLRSF